MTSKTPIERLLIYADNHLYERGGSNTLWEDVMDIADDIKAEYMKLPVDADGVPIRPGDLLVDTTSDYELYATKMFLGLNGWAINARRPDELRHVKPDTVEDIIMEAMQHAFSAPYKGGTLDMGDKVAEYAERIRKVVEDE